MTLSTETVSGERLEPCPFCGSDDLIVMDDDSGDYRQHFEMWVECCACDARSSQIKYLASTEAEVKNSAIAAWNRRALSPSHGEAVAYIEREVLAELGKHRDATGTVVSGLLKKPFGDPVPLYLSPDSLPLGGVKALEKFLVLFAEKVGPLYIEDIHEAFASLPPALKPIEPEGISEDQIAAARNSIIGCPLNDDQIRRLLTAALNGAVK